MRPSTRYRDVLYAALGIVGFSGWLLYILACLPTVGWSPDNSKILFVYQRSDIEETGVALYDRTTGATRRLFVSSDPDATVLSSWTQDGKYAIVYEIVEGPCYDETLNILLVPVGTDEPLRLHGGEENSSDFSVLPPQHDGDLILGGELLMRLDPLTGEVEAERDPGEGTVILAAGNGRIFYSKIAEAARGTVEIGELEPEELQLRPLFELKQSDLEPFGVDEIYGAMWVDRSGTRLALIGDGDEHGAIVLCSPAGVERVVTPQIPFKNYRLGVLQWSPDGKTIYAGIVTPSDDPERLQFSLAEIPVGGGPARLVPIMKLRGEVSALGPGSTPLILPTTALSPDGSMIAAATTMSELLEQGPAPETAALFLIDLRDPQRPVSEVRPVFLKSSVPTR